MVEYWNVGLNKELIHFIASLSRRILPIDEYPIIPKMFLSLYSLNKLRWKQGCGGADGGSP
jgi:hypothetical protein